MDKPRLNVVRRHCSDPVTLWCLINDCISLLFLAGKSGCCLVYSFHHFLPPFVISHSQERESVSCSGCF